jgi:two-component system chemotaxis response regulator CheY
MASLEKVRFLIVDDNVHMLNIVKTLLRGFGALKVLEAKSTNDAFDKIREEAIDIVLLDYEMDDEDGVAFLTRLRRDPKSPAPFMPVIMLTSHSERTRVEAARDAGVSEFCAKPVTAAELLRKIAAVIDSPRAFIRADTYVGPDRRRRDDPEFPGPERRKDRMKAAPATDRAEGSDGAVTRQ